MQQTIRMYPMLDDKYRNTWLSDKSKTNDMQMHIGME